MIVGNFAFSYDQAKAQLAAWAIMASPLIMSNDLRNMDPKMKALLQNTAVIQVNQDAMGKQGRRVYNVSHSKNKSIMVYGRQISRKMIFIFGSGQYNQLLRIAIHTP